MVEIDCKNKFLSISY